MTDQDGWIRLTDYCERYSERIGTVRKRVHDGTWRRGWHYSLPESNSAPFIHEERAREWLRERGRI